ncbi:MAG: RNA polymerase subunit sigma [Gammaproteobacteria bacterium]|nr:RNA polymerase subunit sigma [Gammaproteobacteria bacterium]
MSQDILKQSLSALIDNEADELELRRVLNASNDPEVRASWSRYQIARAAMHSEPFSVQSDLSASIMAAIDAEPALNVNTPEQPAAEVRAKNVYRAPWLGRLAVAASVTLAVLGGVRFYNQDAVQQEAMVAQSEQRLPASSQSQSPVVLASYSAQGEKAPAAQAVSGEEAWYERRLPNYLRQHAQQASVNQTESGLPYARAASLEGQ